MPEIYRGPVQQQKNTTRIGEGSEHEVYRRNDGKIVKEKSPNFHALMNTPEYLHAEFFLTKIAHLLFPNSIPDIHAIHLTSNKGETQTIHEHMDTSIDSYHENVRQSWIDQNHPIPKYELIQDELTQRAQAVTPFQSELMNTGIVLFDRSLQNYIVSPTGIQYVDRLYPLQWDETKGTYISIDTTKLRQAIERKIQDPDQKNVALRYVTRLESFLQELEKQKKK